jgi:tetratricopeptide (TPR) repeat protein
LREPERAIALYQQRFTASPGNLREHRFLAYAYLAGCDYAAARAVIDAGLELAPEDSVLIEFRGEVRAGTGDPDGALADWRHAHQLNPENLSSIYSSAFLLEREGRVEEAAEAWRLIIDWSDARSFALDVEWPRREIERLRGLMT